MQRQPNGLCGFSCQIDAWPSNLYSRAGQIDKWSELKFDECAQGTPAPITARQKSIRYCEPAKATIESVLEFLKVATIAQRLVC